MNFNLNLHIKEILDQYLEIFKDEKNRFDILKGQLNNNESIWIRSNFNWHVTASAFILSKDKKEFAIIHNINLDKWLAPWWHWEEWDNEMYNNAKREAIEETWINELDLLTWHIKNNFIPIDIDTHYIPENLKKNEKEHYHHDFRYIFILKHETNNIKMQLEEIKWLKWMPLKADIKNFSWNNVLAKIRDIC